MPTQLTCEDFGLTQEQMANRLIETMADRLLCSDMSSDDKEEGALFKADTMETRLSEFIAERIDENISNLFDAHIMPRIDEIMANLVVPHTNEWGEKKKEPETLIEYATRIAENYLEEPVDSSGNTKRQGNYNWRKYSTRLMHAVKEHLRYSIDKSIQQASKDVNSEFAKQIVKAVEEAVRNLRISVQTAVK